MYILGGEFEDGDPSQARVHATCERYNPATNAIERIAPLNLARKEHCACVLNGIIFVLGEFNA